MTAEPTIPAVLLSDLAVGDALPELAVEVTATTVVLGALASRDWRPQHHDYMFATKRNGLDNIILNTPNQAAWFERYLTDWTGPFGRLGRMTFRMRTSVYPGDTMVFRGTITDIATDEVGCSWANADVELVVAATDSAAERIATTCNVRVAVPTNPSDNPWSRVGDQWVP